MGTDEPDPPPDDLVNEDVWASIIGLPDYVSLRTSDSHGTQLMVMHELWGSLIEAVGNDQDAMRYALLDAADEFQACTFNSLCGYYRVAASCLRSALDISAIGAYLNLSQRTEDLHEWLAGERKISFGQACDFLQSCPRVEALEHHIESKMGYSIFGQKQGQHEPGWARVLFSRLSEFSHSIPNRTSAKMWEGSNGPIYVTESFGNLFALYLENIALEYILVKLARLDFKKPSQVKHLFQSATARPSKVAIYAYEFLW